MNATAQPARTPLVAASYAIRRLSALIVSFVTTGQSWAQQAAVKKQAALPLNGQRRRVKRHRALLGVGVDGVLHH